MSFCIPESQLYLGLHPKQSEGGDSAPLLHCGDTPPGVSCPALQTSVQGKYEPENNQRAGAHFLCGKTDRIGFVQPGENSRETLLQAFIT